MRQSICFISKWTVFPCMFLGPDFLILDRNTTKQDFFSRSHRYRRPDYSKMAKKDLPGLVGQLSGLGFARPGRTTVRDLEMKEMKAPPPSRLQRLLVKPRPRTQDRDMSVHLLSEDEEE